MTEPETNSEASPYQPIRIDGRALLGGAAVYADARATAVEAATRHELRYQQLRWEGLNDEQAREALAEFVAYANARWRPADDYWYEWLRQRIDEWRELGPPAPGEPWTRPQPPHPFAPLLRAVEDFAAYINEVWAPVATNIRPGNHALAVQTLRAYRLKPRHLGIDLGCACHTLPNPAARDYRRRTKHRNRRRR